MTRDSAILKAEKVLREAGLYSTRARVAILNVLLDAGGPLDKNEIVRRLGTSGPDEVTVYRTLERLCEKGLVHKVFLGGRACRFELAHNCGHIQCHPHFTCRSCGVTRCVTGVTVPLVEGLQKGYRIMRQQVRLEGICAQCSKKT